VRGIVPLDEQWCLCARQHLDTLTKPLGSLGRLENLAAQMVRGTKDILRIAESIAVISNAGVMGVVPRTLCGPDEQTSWTLMRPYCCTNRFGQRDMRLQEVPG
jgi:Phosphoribosyltransferase